jgi:hypothetical protein
MLDATARLADVQRFFPTAIVADLPQASSLLQKLDHLAVGACHEGDANFYQRVLTQDRCAWRNA